MLENLLWSYRFNVDSRYIIYSGDHFNFIQHFAATGGSGSDWWRVEMEREREDKKCCWYISTVSGQ